MANLKPIEEIHILEILLLVCTQHLQLLSAMTYLHIVFNYLKTVWGDTTRITFKPIVLTAPHYKFSVQYFSL